MVRDTMLEDEIVAFATRNGGHIASVLPLLDHLDKAHPEMPPEDLVAQVDAGFDRLYRAGRAWFAGHRWLNEQPASVAGFLHARFAELRHDPTTGRWSWRDTAWTENITVR